MKTRGASTSAYALIDTQPHACCPHADYVRSAITSLTHGALSIETNCVRFTFGSLYRERKKERKRGRRRRPCANETGFSVEPRSQRSQLTLTARTAQSVGFRVHRNSYSKPFSIVFVSGIRRGFFIPLSGKSDA